jgi:hypothetical protein
MLGSAVGFTTKLEIIVIVNASGPGTALRDALRHAEVDSRVRVIAERGISKAKAVERGFREAEGEILGFADGDLGCQADSTEVAEMLDIVARGEAACVVAQRDRSRWSTIRRAKTTAFSSISHLLFRLEVSDSQAGLKFFTRDAVDFLLSNCMFSGWEFDVELLWWMQKADFSIHSYPVAWYVERSDHSALDTMLVALAHGIPTLAGLVRLRVRLFRASLRARIPRDTGLACSYPSRSGRTDESSR